VWIKKSSPIGCCPKLGNVGMTGHTDWGLIQIDTSKLYQYGPLGRALRDFERRLGHLCPQVAAAPELSYSCAFGAVAPCDRRFRFHITRRTA